MLLHKHVEMAVASLAPQPRSLISQGEQLQSRRMHGDSTAFTAITLPQLIGQPYVQMHPEDNRNVSWLVQAMLLCERSAYA